MRLIQISPTLQYGDAIGNDMLAIARLGAELGFRSEIYTESIHPRITEPFVKLLSQLPKLAPEDVMLYHFAIGSPLNRAVLQYPCRRVMVYHNITPPEFFARYAPEKSVVCQAGLNDARALANKFDYCIADSEFNKQDLINMGYKADKIAVVPVLIPFDDYKADYDEDYYASLRQDDYKNFLFVGRVAPNKKQEDVIRAFAYYKHNISSKARLILAGNPKAVPSYFDDLVAYTESLSLSDVIFTGHITFAQMLSCYRAADVFVCMSEHEGFCVPLLEAMTFDVPVLALDRAAVGETMGDSGVVLDSNDSVLVARVMERMVKDEAWREEIIAAQQKRLTYFQESSVKERFAAVLSDIVNETEKQQLSVFEEYDALYNLVEERLSKEGKHCGFTKEAFRYTAEQIPHTVDVASLVEAGYPNKAFLEAAYLAFFNRLPDDKARELWAADIEALDEMTFRKKLITVLVGSQESRDKGTRVCFNPFCAPLPQIEAAHAVQRPSFLRRVKRKLGAMLRA